MSDEKTEYVEGQVTGQVGSLDIEGLDRRTIFSAFALVGMLANPNRKFSAIDTVRAVDALICELDKEPSP